MSKCREVTPIKTLGGPKVKNLDLFGQGGKCGHFCGQLSAKGANASTEGTKSFEGGRNYKIFKQKRII